MKKLSKFFISFAIIVILFQVCNIVFFVMAPDALAESPADEARSKLVEPDVKIPFPGINLDFSKESIVIDDNCRNSDGVMCMKISWIGDYLVGAYKYAVVLGSLIATLMMIIGGLMYVLAGMNPNLIGKAKGYITGSVLGLVLLLGSYVLLNTINPNLVQLQPIEVEIVKTVILSESSGCLGAMKEGFTVEPADWNKGGDNCGDELKITKESATETAGSQTCIADFCKQKGYNCIQLSDTKEWKCKQVFMYGIINYPAALDSLTCGHMVSAYAANKRKSGFYLDTVQLMAVNPNPVFTKYDYNAVVALTAKKTIGAGVKSYYFENADVTPPPSNDYQLYLKLEINDFSWPYAPTVDDVVDAVGSKKTDGQLKLALLCPKNGYGLRFYTLTKKGDGVMWELPEALRWRDVLAYTGGAHWDLNITKDFYDCEAGETWDYDSTCKWATQAADGLMQYGQPCENSTDCVNPDKLKFPLIGANKILRCGKDSVCNFGSYGDKCQRYSSAFTGSVALGQCGYNFACRETDDAGDQCVLSASDVKLGYAVRCDPENNTCATGMTCSNVHKIWETGETNFANCKRDDTGTASDTKIDTYVCGKNSGMCFCRDDSECPDKAPHCYVDESFCTTGKPGSPCDADDDCVTYTVQTQICKNNTCAFGERAGSKEINYGFYDKALEFADFSANYNHTQPKAPWE